MNTYDPADDEEPDYEPEYDGEHFTEPDDLSDEDYLAYRLWAASQPQREVTHSCGHTRTYLDVAGVPGMPASAPCYECQPYDDPFAE